MGTYSESCYNMDSRLTLYYQKEMIPQVPLGTNEGLVSVQKRF